jgi:sugar lactone lactonase YvrE
LGSLSIATATPATTSLTFTFGTSTTIAAPAVLTLGAANLDFTDAGTGTCTTNGTSHTYNSGDTCTVNVTFTPTLAGPRYGGVTLTNSSGALIATAYLSGTGTGPQVTYSPAVQSSLGSGFLLPAGVAVDGNGNVFVADSYSHTVKEILAAGGYTTINPIGSGFSVPTGVAVDGNGNVFVADETNNSVTEILAAGGYTTVNTLAGSFVFNTPIGVAVDGNGNVFVTDQGNSAVREIVAAGGYTTVNTLGTGFSQPFGVAVDGNGNVFVTDQGNSAVSEIVAAGGYTTVNTLGSGFSTPAGVAVDRNGNVFVADFDNNAVKEILAAGGYTTVNTVESGFANPTGLTVDGNGNVFVSGFIYGPVVKLDFADPPALSFATTAVGNTSSDSPQTITIRNSGNATLTFPVPTSGLNPSIASGFTIGGSSTCPQLTTSSSAATLTAGASCTYLVNFTPVAADSASGSLATTDNALNSTGPSYTTQSIALSGTGTGPPTITFSVPNHTYGDAPFTVSATSNSAGAFTYSVVSGAATISGSTVTLTGGGAVVLQASEAASGYYAAATQNATFTVAGFTTPVTNLGSLAIATATPATTSLTFTFGTSTTIAPPAVLTLGAPNLDFTDAGTGTCTTNGTSHSYSVGDGCTVNVTFTPKFAGPRYGGVTLTNASGALIASAYLSGVGTGPQVTFSPAVQTTVASGLSFPWGVAVDGNGNIFVADYENSAVKEIPAAGGATVTLGSGFSYPFGVAVDGNGNVFVADSNNSAVKEILAAGGYTTVHTLGSGFGLPFGVAVDGSGNVFVADAGSHAVKEMLAAGGYTTVHTLGSGFNAPTGVAVDRSGNVFVSDQNNNAVYEILAAGGYTTVNSLGSGFIYPSGVAVDASGNVFVADRGHDAVKEILAVGGYTTVNTLESNAGGPADIALDASANVFFTGTSNNLVEKLDFADPPALSFATTAVGSTSSDSPQTVTVTNSGNATLTFPVPTSDLNPTIASGFTIGGSSTCPQLTPSSSAATLAAGASCTYLLNFTPVAIGAISGSLATTDNALNSTGPNYTTQNITLSGTATGPPTITFSVPNHTYGDAPFEVSATSNSYGALTYSVVSGPATISGAIVTLTGGGTVVLASSQTASGDYTAGTQNATLTVAGFATPASNLGSLSIATATPATTSLTFTFGTSTTIAAPAVLTLGAANLDFTDAGTGTCTTNGTSHSYSVGDSCTVDVTFTPKFAGPRYGGVTLTNTSGVLIASAYVSGLGTGPQVTFSPAVSTTLGSGFNTPYGIAVDGTGNVFVADDTAGAVYEILAAGGYTTVNTLGSGFYGPAGIAVDGNGNVFVSDVANNAVKEILAAGGYTIINTVGNGFYGPWGIAVDGNGNVFVADSANHAIKEILGAGGYTTINTLGGSFVFGGPVAVALDGNGNVVVADSSNNAVYEILAAGGYTTVNPLGSGFSYPSGVAVDGSGNVFVSDRGHDAVKEILAVGGYTTVKTLNSNAGSPAGIAVDASANVFFTGTSNNLVEKLDFADPPALSFLSTAVGSISSDSPQTVTVTNSGNATLTFPVPTSGLNPTIASGFTIGGSSTCPQLTTSSSAATLAAGTSCTYLLNFTPVAVGAISGSLAPTDNALNSTGPSYTTQSIALSGTATGPPTITFSVPDHTYGDAPFTVSATSNSSGAFTYSVVSGPATISGSTVTLTAAGAVVLQASEVASGDYFVGTQNATFAVAAASPAIAFTVSNQTYGAAPFAVRATSNSTGAFTYSVISGAATISGATVTLTGAGSVVLQASEAATSNYLAGTRNATVTVAAASPTIAFTVSNQTYGAAPFTVSATSNSTGAFTYSVVSGPAAISGSTLTLTGTGAVVLQASQAASSDYATGTQNATFTVAAGAPNIAFTVANQTYGAAPFTVGATSNSTGAFTYSVVSGPATISGSTLALTGTGTVVLQASEAASSDYATGTQNATFTVAAGTPNITFTVANQTYGAAPFTVSAISNSSGAFTYSVVSGPASISGVTVTVTGAGTVVLQASEASTSNYLVGTRNATVIVATDTPSITFAVPSHTFGDAPFAVSATSNSSGAFTYSVVSGPATISGSTVTITKAGTVVLRASESASVNFSAGSETASFIVATTVGIAPSSGSTSEATVAAGAAATFPLTFTPEGATTFTGKITFSISGLPPGATATFSPASIAAGSPVTPVTLTIQTSSQTGKQRKPSGRDPFASLAWGLLLLPIAGSKRVRRHLRSLPLAMLIVCVLGMLSFVGCGGSVITPVSPAAQTYNLVVTAANAASGVKIITNLTLTVQ